MCWDTTFLGYTLQQRKNFISLLRQWHHKKRWRVIKKVMKEKSFCQLKVISHAVQVRQVGGKHSILWRQTFHDVQAWTNLTCPNIGGPQWFRSFVIARDGLLVFAAELCCFHHCPSHLLSHGCRLKCNQLLTNHEYICSPLMLLYKIISSKNRLNNFIKDMIGPSWIIVYD